MTPLLFFLPKATLAATIVVAVLTLVDFSVLKNAWSYSKVDFAAVFATIVLTLGFGVEAGVSAGVLLSIGLFLYKTSKPHVAEVGLVVGTEHFRNINRHEVETYPNLVTLRVDESLYFANAAFLQDMVYDRIACEQPIRHVVLMCSAVNEIDMSALESLEAINHRPDVREEVVLDLVGQSTAVPIQQAALGAEVAGGLELVAHGVVLHDCPFLCWHVVVVLHDVGRLENDAKC